MQGRSLKNLKRHHEAVFLELDQELRDRYLQKDKAVAFGMVKPSEAGRTLKVMAEDLFGLVEGFRNNESVVAMHSYKLLVRLLEEQCIVEADPATRQPKVVVKPNSELLADTAYGSEDNRRHAGKRGVELIAPVPGKEADGKIPLSEFAFNKDGSVKQCPMGHAPMRSRRKNGNHSAGFDGSLCRRCSLCSRCPVKKGKRGYYLRYTKRALLLSLRRAEEKTGSFREKYRFRAGIEAAFSALDRLTGFKRLRYRGFNRVKMSVILKIPGLNIRRAAAYRALLQGNGGENPPGKGLFVLLFKDLSTEIQLHVLPSWRLKINRGRLRRYRLPIAA